MALDFPNSPTLGQVFISNSKKWIWSGEQWVAANFYSSGNTVTGPSRFNGDVTVFGNLSATGTSYFANTVYTTTSALSVINLGNTGPAFYVGNNGTGDIASFYDLDQNVEVLHVGGNNGTFPNVGIKTSQPNKDLTVKGELSASGLIYSNGRVLKPLSGVGGIVVNDSLTNVTVISAENQISGSLLAAFVGNILFK